jgi:hemerythrin-like metal-binding protein
MPLQEWNDSFSVCHPELDEQHRRWLTIINDLHAGMEEGKGDGPAAVAVSALEAMMEYARKHFLAEERYMREIGFPGTIGHIKSHNECYGRIATQLLTAESGGRVQTGELLSFLKEWLAEHILTEDRKYYLHVLRSRNKV